MSKWRSEYGTASPPLSKVVGHRSKPASLTPLTVAVPKRFQRAPGPRSSSPSVATLRVPYTDTVSDPSAVQTKFSRDRPVGPIVPDTVADDLINGVRAGSEVNDEHCGRWWRFSAENYFDGHCNSVYSVDTTL